MEHIKTFRTKLPRKLKKKNKKEGILNLTTVVRKIVPAEFITVNIGI